MIIDSEKDIGKIVWARLTGKEPMWAAMILSTKKLNLIFEEKIGKTWVWWFADKSFSQLNNNLISAFNEDFEINSARAKGQRKYGIFEALEILSYRHEIHIPDEIIRTDNIIPWAADNLIDNIQCHIGKHKRGDMLYIPNDILKTIRDLNDKNIQVKIQQNIKNALKQPKGQKKKFENLQLSNDEDYCLSCQIMINGEKNKHPWFIGFICDHCYKNVKKFIMPISYDNHNDICCVCFCGKESKLVYLCSYCVRIFCQQCLNMFCGETMLRTIYSEDNWRCFACNENEYVLPCGLRRRSLDEQLLHVYSLYTPIETYNETYQVEEINVLALNDDQNLVPLILNTLEFPFKSFGRHGTSNNNITIHKPGHLKLLIQYYPNKENYDKYIFDTDDVLDQLYYFTYEKNQLMDQKYLEPTFWAFETSASITLRQRKTISRFCEKQPVMLTLGVKDVRQRCRFIWTNITIHKKNIEEHRNKINIFNQEVSDNAVLEDTDTPWCYSSIFMLLSCLVQNNIK